MNEKELVEIYHKKHILVWDKIIELLKENESYSTWLAISLKQKAFNLLGFEETHNLCFGCDFSILYFEGDCDFCFFDIAQDKGCLNGYYSLFYDNKNGKEKRILYAEKIRNFPIKDEYIY